MKTIWKTLILVVLTLSLVVALLACTNKEDPYDDDSWMKDDVSTEDEGNVAHKAETDDEENANAHQSSERVPLPTIPW